MKIFFILLGLTLMLSGCEKDKTVDYDSLQTRDGLIYIKDESGSFSGTAETRDKNGELKSSITYKNGKKDDSIRSWGENGEIL